MSFPYHKHPFALMDLSQEGTWTVTLWVPPAGIWRRVSEPASVETLAEANRLAAMMSNSTGALVTVTPLPRRVA